MGCKECNIELEQEKMDILYDERQDSPWSKVDSKLQFSEKDIQILKDNHYSNPNDEQALINYLKALKSNKHNKEFERELIIYFDVLSAKNRCLFTGIRDFISSIDIFKIVIEFIYNYNIKELQEKEYYQKKYDICGRIKYITSQSFTNTDLKPYFSKKNESLTDEMEGLEKIKREKKFQKISLSNTELYFNVLLQAYFETIEKADEAQINNIIYITRQLFHLILEYLKLIKNNHKFSEDDIRIIRILIYAPIIANDNDNIERLISNIKNKNDNEYNIHESRDIIISNNKLIFKNDRNAGPAIKIENKEFENPHIYNIKLIKEDITKEHQKEKLTKISLMKYIKIQYFQNSNFYTHDKNYWAFNKNILKYVLQSKTIKTLFEFLYPKYEFLFNNKENIDKLFDSIIFVPFDLYNSYGITFRKELIIFIEGLFDGFSKPMHYLSKSSSFIILGIHEGCGHWSSSFYSIIYNNYSLSDSFSENKEVKDELKLIEKNENDLEEESYESKDDGGDKIELLLFGRKIEYFTVKEILFLLCRNSYDVDYKTFRKNFMKVSKTKFDELYGKISMNPEFVDLLKNFKINKDYFLTSKKNKNKLNYWFKRNGEILIRSKCGELKF